MRSLLAILAGSIVFGAVSSSSHFKLQDYGVNSGGTNSSASATYKAQGTTGEVTGNSTAGTTYKLKPGSISVEQSNVPPAPTLGNGSDAYYNKLSFIINTGNNPSDATYSVAVSTTSNFASTSYVQADGTLGSSPVYRDYTTWGGAGGSLAIGLSQNTTYYFKVNASDGKFTTSAYGPSASIATGAPALTFSVSPNNLNLGNLDAGTVITSSTVSFSFNTNSAAGGNVYVAGDTTGLSAGGHTITITPPSSNLDSLSEGYGLQALSASLPLTIQPPYDGMGDTVGAVYTSFVPIYSSSSPLSGASATAQLMAKAAATTPNSSNYTNVLTFVAAASY